ncbi:MAG TPA: VWA domain-containing protein [Acidobacteriota bacterium]
MIYFQRLVTSLIFLVFLLTVPNQGTAQQSQTEYTESVEVELIDVYLSATDSKGRIIDDLKKEDLVLKEDGIPQEIKEFSVLGTRQTDIDLVVALVIDVSNSMHEGSKEVSKMDIAKAAAREIMRLLRPQDQIMLVSFDTRVKVISALTSDMTKMESAVSALQPSYGRTAMWDGIHAAAETMSAVEGRKIMYVCSDGLDNASKLKVEEVVAKDLGASEITVISLGTIEFERGGHYYGQENDYRDGKQTMQTLADKTGGYAFFPEKAKDLPQMLEKVRSGVQSLYSVAYESSNPEKDGSWRKIEIETKRKGIKLKYRDGYYATP